jgi:hypothetical protein
MARIKERALAAAQQAGAKPEQARAYADAAYKLDYKSMRKLERNIGIKPDVAKEIEATSYGDLSKSPVFWLSPGFSEGSRFLAYAARQPLGSKAKRKVMSLGRARGMDAKTQKEFWKAFDAVKVNDLAKLAREYDISKSSVTRLQNLSKARKKAIVSRQEMPKIMGQKVDSIRAARAARAVGVPLATILGNGFSRPGLSPLEDIKFGLPTSVIAGATTLAGTNALIHDSHLKLNDHIQNSPQLRERVKGVSGFARVSRQGHLVATDELPTMGAYRILADPNLATRTQLRAILNVVI